MNGLASGTIRGNQVQATASGAAFTGLDINGSSGSIQSDVIVEANEVLANDGVGISWDLHEPNPAEPLFEYRIESAVRDYVRYLVLVGQIDPINQLYVADELQDVTETGEFRYEDFAYHGATVQVSIVTPLGDVTTYDVSLL